MKLLRKGGMPFLLLPGNSRLRAAALDLYAPQSKAARGMKWGFVFASRLGLGFALENRTVVFRADDSFRQFLSQVAGTNDPQFAMLAGNPNTKGQRCVFLVFDAQGKPAVVIKAGAGPDAKRLITQELDFLKQAPRDLPGIPKAQSVFANDRLSAFAMDFYQGVSPRFNDLSSVHKILNAWAAAERISTVAELPVWKRLLTEAASNLSPKARELGGKTLGTVIQHGDFAPWNIRVRHGEWMVLDWERGEASGLPVWDWLHFVIQPAVLVEHLSPRQVLIRLNELFENPLFLNYSDQTRTRGIITALTSAYLDYCIYVTKQTEGLETISALGRLVEKAPWSHG